MARVVITGNAGGGKFTLARMLAEQGGLHHVEIDRLLWRPGWKLTPADVYNRHHDEIIAGDDWIIDGLGQQASILRRLARASAVVLIHMPLWMHFWLAADRQIAWANGTLKDAPERVGEIPLTRALFQNVWEVEQTWMLEIRMLCLSAEKAGNPTIKLENADELDRFYFRSFN